MFSATTQVLINMFVGKLDGLMAQVPVVSRYYFIVRNWLALPRPQ